MIVVSRDPQSVMAAIAAVRLKQRERVMGICREDDEDQTGPHELGHSRDEIYLDLDDDEEDEDEEDDDD